jgi:hypothetical protein
MPFRITKEMRMMREAELGFSPEVKIAQYREHFERQRWRRLQQVIGMRRALRTRTSWAPEIESGETYRPSSPNYLYLLARETKDGDYQSYKRFVNYFGLEATGDTIVAAAEQLRVTFEPRGNNRRAWWREPSADAWEWLRGKIAQQPYERGFIQLNPALVEPKDQHADKRKVLDPDLREFELREAVYAALPEKQAEVVWLYHMFHDDARPRETTGLIAEALGISPATVRWHKAEAAKNPQFRRALGRW